MQILAIGVGGAGIRMLDFLLHRPEEGVLEKFKETFGARKYFDYKDNLTPLAVDTSRPHLENLKSIEEKDKILIGKYDAKGHGTGSDISLGERIAEKEIDRIETKLQDVAGQVDFCLIMHSLGGGTGGGATPVISEVARRVLEVPVYTVSILPSLEESNIYILNAVDAMKSVLGKVDGVILVDNGVVTEKIVKIPIYEQVNLYVSRFVRTLVRASVESGIIGSSSVIGTMSPFDGVSTIGNVSSGINKLGKGKKWISFLMNKVIKGKGGLGLLLNCDYKTAQRALLLIVGPPEKVSDTFHDAREWLQNQIPGIAVRGGEYHVPNSTQVEIGVLLSGLTEVTAIKELYKRAKEITEVIREKKEELKVRKEEFIKLFEESDIEPLF